MKYEPAKFRLAAGASRFAVGVAVGLLATTASAQNQSVSNPYQGARMYVSPDYRAHIQATRAAVPELSDELQPLESVSTAFWLTAIAHVPGLEPRLAAAEAEANQSGEDVVFTLVVYNLPERDCAAIASAGEITLQNGGLDRYRSEFIDPIAAAIRAHPGVRVSVILEPDSLTNLATNLHIPKCARAGSIYVDGIVYALRQLSMPNVALYLDAAHAGWLGWESGRRAAAQVFRDVLDQAGPNVRHRGFATNTSNYTPTYALDPDPLGQEYYQWNPAHDETTYAELLQQDLAAVGIANRQIVIDTSRNGNPLARTNSGSWCNVREAGLGERPRAEPVEGIDAFLWVKPPGESDGSSVDPACQGVDSAPGAPAAGQWFLDHFVSMARRASPPL